MAKLDSGVAQQLLVPVMAMAAALATALLLAGCGGGDDVPIALRASPAAAAVPATTTTSAAPLNLRLEGCVVDEYFQLRGDTPVRALGADGRLLGNAHSDPRGAFSLRLPTGQNVSLAVDRPGGDVMKVATGHRSRALTTCLVDPSA